MKTSRTTCEVACALLVALLASAAFGTQVALPSPAHDAMARASTQHRPDARPSEPRGDAG
jgi:hypothetical protein